MQRRGGTIEFQVDGIKQDAKGSFSYGGLSPKREVITGADGIHGYKESPVSGYIEGEITDRGTLDLAALFNVTDGTVTLALANGKVIVLRGAVFTGEGTAQTEEGNVSVRFDGQIEEVI